MKDAETTLSAEVAALVFCGRRLITTVMSRGASLIGGGPEGEGFGLGEALEGAGRISRR